MELARLNLQRAKELLPENVITQSDFDSADAEFKQAAAQVDAIRATIAQLAGAEHAESVPVLYGGSVTADSFAEFINEPTGTYEKITLEKAMAIAGQQNVTVGKTGVSIEKMAAFIESRDIPQMLDMISESSERVAKIIDNAIG